MTANRALECLPELDAIRSRIGIIHLQASDQQMRAMMRSLAARGYQREGKRIDAAECGMICDFIMEESMSLHRQLDMRILVNSCQDYLQWQQGDSGCHWRDLIASRLRERPVGFLEQVHFGGPAARKER